MVIDLTSLMIGNDLELDLDLDIQIPSSYLENSSIRGLKDTSFKGDIVRLSDGDFQLSGELRGVMVLPDDVTLEDVDYSYCVDILEDFNEMYRENSLQIIQNKLDITEFLWQNILLEVPSKVKKDGNEDLTMEGDGWRLITEEEYSHSNNSPFSELSKMFDSGKE